MTEELFQSIRIYCNYSYLLIEPGLLILLIFRRKNIPKKVFILLFISILIWILDTTKIVTRFISSDEILHRNIIVFDILIQFIVKFGLYYFYISPKKWQPYFRVIFLLGFLLLCFQLYLNVYILNTYPTYLTETYTYLVFTPLALISLFQINKSEMEYKWFASPRFYLSSAEFLYLFLNSSMFLFRVQLYELNKDLFFIVATVHLFTWYPFCFLFYKAISTFDAKKEEL